MAFKQFLDPDLGDIKIYKRKGTRNLRLSLSAGGGIRVSIPTWAPYTSGLSFAHSKRDWIAAQRPTKLVLRDGQPVGKFHRLVFQPHTAAIKPTSRIKQTEIIISYPENLTSTSPAVQKIAQTAGIRALRNQAEQQLPPRLKQLADKYGFEYHSVSIKQLRGRWGSCDQQKNIVLNLFLMQLPWQCIDYVLLHELTHTQVLRHGPPFWEAMDTVMPNAKAVRAQMRGYQPILTVQSPLAVSY